MNLIRKLLILPLLALLCTGAMIVGVVYFSVGKEVQASRKESANVLFQLIQILHQDFVSTAKFLSQSTQMTNALLSFEAGDPTLLKDFEKEMQELNVAEMILLDRNRTLIYPEGYLLPQSFLNRIQTDTFASEGMLLTPNQIFVHAPILDGGRVEGYLVFSLPLSEVTREYLRLVPEATLSSFENTEDAISKAERVEAAFARMFETTEGALNSFTATVMTGLLIYVLLVAAILYFSVDPVLKRIRSHTKKLRLMGNDESMVRLVDEDQDEIGYMCLTINEMMDQLGKKNQDLRDKAEELEVARDRALAAATAKTLFLANMSHEIRTPMNGVIGMIDLLLDSELNEDQRYLAEKATSCADTLLDIINEILDFSKLESGEVEMESISVDIEEALVDVTDLLAIRAHEKHLELAYWIDPDIPGVLGDPTRLRQVLTNLIGNAVKFTTTGEVRVRASKVKTQREKIWVKFEVQDTGIGISEEHRADIFGVFTQADSSTTRKFGGTGLGLAISQKLVGYMGGALEVDSEENKGSCFYFTLPFTIDHQTQKPDHVDEFPPGFRVLGVDDNATNREILKRYLTCWLVEHTIVATPAAAIDELVRAQDEGRPYSVALLDFNMPEKDGYKLAEEIRENSRISTTKLVLLSSSCKTEGDAKSYGFDKSLTKPLHRSRLMRTLLSLADSVSPPQSCSQSFPHAKEKSEEPSARAHRVLIVDDCEDNRILFEKQLRQMKLDCLAVTNGREAVDACSNQSFDLILMDCQMPVLSGWEASREIRDFETKHAKPRIPIVAVTANTLSSCEEECFEAGMDAFLRKPIRMNALKEVIRENLPALEK